jgi:conjugal transfer/entry exclusion protein
LVPSSIRRKLAACTACGASLRLPDDRAFGYKVAPQSAWIFMTRTRLMAAALAMALPFTAQADETRAVDLAALGQGINRNLERLQQCASTVQQCQTQLRQLHQQLVDATRPGVELYVKAQQTWQGLQQVQRIFQDGSLYLQQLGDWGYYRARASSAQDPPLPGDGSQAQTGSAVHLQRHH